MVETRNSTGRPLAGSAWLEAHHRAKLPERRLFCERLAAFQPKRLVDLGCATGLWLDELDKVMPDDCEFVGLDSDEVSLVEAEERAQKWSRSRRFDHADINGSALRAPEADLTLFFNLSPYVSGLQELFRTLADQTQRLVVRQYDGAALRFGPMPSEGRSIVEHSLRVALAGSEQFKHYDMDRVFEAIEASPFEARDIEFELFARTNPFPPESMAYISGMFAWTQDYLSETAAETLQAWWEPRQADSAVPTYFTEFDLIAVLS